MCRTAAPARLSSPSLLPLLPLQLHDLHSQLTALSQQGAVTLGLNPNTVPRPAAPELRSPSPPPPQQRAASPTAASGKSASPVRNSFSLAGWGSSQSPQRAARSPSLAPLRVVVDGAADGEEQPRSPALVYAQRAHECKEQAAAASQHVDAELRQSGSPGRLARLFGRVHLGGGGGHGSSNGSPARGSTPEATYELLLPPPPPPQQQQQCQERTAAAAAGSRPVTAAAHPLRCSNSASSDAGGSRVGSPRDAAMCGAAPENRSRPPTSGSGTVTPKGEAQQPQPGRPRSGGSGGSAAAAAPHRSPRRQAWKPL